MKNVCDWRENCVEKWIKKEHSDRKVIEMSFQRCSQEKKIQLSIVCYLSPKGVRLLSINFLDLKLSVKFGIKLKSFTCSHRKWILSKLYPLSKYVFTMKKCMRFNLMEIQSNATNLHSSNMKCYWFYWATWNV